jgi:hypothetical protein
MTELVCELIVTLDGFARGQRSPGYYGYFGPDVADWIKANTAVSHRMLIGRRTYEARDEGYESMKAMPGWLFSVHWGAADWPGLKIVHDDLVDFVRELKRPHGFELRTLL